MNTRTMQTPNQVEMTLNRHCPLVTCGQEVKRGERLATASVPGKGDIHTPIPGKVVHVDPYRIRVTLNVGKTVDTVDLGDLKGNELLNTLRELGADLPEKAKVKTLIINGVDAEQGILTRSTLLADHSEALAAGVKTLSEAYTPEESFLAALKETPQGLGTLKNIAISEQYPSGLDPMVVKEATGIEAPEDAAVIGLETVFHVGRIMETGLPAMETLVTLEDTCALVPLGMAVGEILNSTGEIIQNRDRILLGGPLRGTAAASPHQGVDRSTNAVTVVSSPAPVATDAACVGCGECIRHCPARLDPSMITSYAEFGMYDKAAELHVNACFECGLCGFFCIARRPMLQYIRLAKTELAQAEARSGEEN